MLHIVHRAQEGMDLRAPCDPVRPELPDEQQHLAPSLPAVDECIATQWESPPLWCSGFASGTGFR